MLSISAKGTQSDLTPRSGSPIRSFQHSHTLGVEGEQRGGFWDRRQGRGAPGE